MLCATHYRSTGVFVAQQSMYVRVKRKKLTVFLHVEPNETVLELKQKLQEQVEQVTQLRAWSWISHSTPQVCPCCAASAAAAENG